MSTNGKRSVKTNNSSNNNDSSGIAPATDNIQNFEEAEGMDETSNEKKSLKDLPKADSGKGESLNIDNDTQRYRDKEGSVTEREKSLKKGDSGNVDDFPSIIEDEHTYFEQSGESDINGDRRNNQGSLKTYCDTAASTCLDRPATQINVGKEERRKKGISDHHSLSSSSMDQTTMCIPNGYRHPQALPTVALSNNESSRQVRSSQSPTYALASGLQANEIVINEPSLDPTSLLEESNHLTKELPSSSLVSTNILNQMTEELMNVRHINQYLMQLDVENKKRVQVLTEFSKNICVQSEQDKKSLSDKCKEKETSIRELKSENDQLWRMMQELKEDNESKKLEAQQHEKMVKELEKETMICKVETERHVKRIKKLEEEIKICKIQKEVMELKLQPLHNELGLRIRNSSAGRSAELESHPEDLQPYQGDENTEVKQAGRGHLITQHAVCSMDVGDIEGIGDEPNPHVPVLQEVFLENDGGATDDETEVKTPVIENPMDL